MIEENLSILLKGLAVEIEDHQAGLEALGAEANEFLAELDDLTTFLRDQSHILGRQNDDPGYGER